MSRRAILRGFFLCVVSIVLVVAAFPAGAQGTVGTITFSPNPVTLAVGDVSPLITATLQFPVGYTQGGTQTLLFNGGDGPGYGISTVPSTVTFTTTKGQTTATVSFRLAAAPIAFPGGQETSVASTPDSAYGLLNFNVEPFSVVPSATSVYTGNTSAQLMATVAYGQLSPTAPQQLVFSGLPAGASPVPSPVSFTVGLRAAYAEVPFQIAVSSATAPGRYQVTVGTSPIVTGSDTFILEVLSAGALGATVGLASIDVCAGGAGVQNTLTVTPLNGYAGSPTVTFPALPSDLRITPSSITVPTLPPTRTVAFEVTAAALATPGQKVVNVLVSDPRGPFATASFVVNVGAADFAPAVSPGAISLTSGGEAATVSASLQAGGCAPPSTITVTPSGLPAGVTVTPTSGVLSAPSYTPIAFVFKATPAAAGGTKNVTFTFSTATGASKTANVTVTVVRTGRIGVSVERPSMDVCPGGVPRPNTLTISPLDGYVGTPTVTFPSLPAGLTVTPATIPVPALPPSRIVAFTVRAAAGLAAGSRTVTALVSDPRGITATATFAAVVLPPAFTPVAAPSAATINAGGSAVTIAASLVPGACPPSTNVTVTPSGLPAGVVVTPTSAVLSPPAFGPAQFTFQAGASALPGPSTITFTYAVVGSSPKSTTAVITVCGPPSAPTSPVIRPQGNPNGPVTATDFLALQWGAPAAGFPPTRYEWRLNGGAWTSTTALAATAPPRGTLDPLQLFVRGYACNPAKGPGAEASSPIYPLGPPVANFSVPASIVAGRAVTFTDTSSPQATSWLWFPGDGVPATTVQSPTVTFPAAGPKVIVLVATNGSGSSTRSTSINVLPASAARSATSLAVRSMDREPDGRLALGRVEVVAGTTLLLRRLAGEGDAVAFLRLLDADGRVAAERRLVLAEGEEARHDLSAFATGVFRVEVVGPEGLEAAVEEQALRLGEPDPGPPVSPRRPGGARIR